MDTYELDELLELLDDQEIDSIDYWTEFRYSNERGRTIHVTVI